MSFTGTCLEPPSKSKIILVHHVYIYTAGRAGFHKKPAGLTLKSPYTITWLHLLKLKSIFFGNWQRIVFLIAGEIEWHNDQIKLVIEMLAES